MKKYERIINKVNRKFKKVKRDFAPVGTRCFWLKREVQSAQLTSVLEIEVFYVKWNKFEGMMEFWVATNETEFNNFSAQSSFLAYGVPDNENKLDVYEFEKKYVIPPSFGDVLWKILAVRIPKERYTIADANNYFTIGGEFITIGGEELGI